MPGPTNPWASELKKSRRGGNKTLKGKEQKSSLLQHPDDDDIQHQDDEKSLNETREAAADTTTTMEKAVDEVKKYVKVQDDDNAAAEVVGGTSKKKDSSPPYSKVNDTHQADAPPKRLKKKSDVNQQVSRSRCKSDADDAVVSKKKVSAKVNDTKTDAPPKVPKKKTDAINPKGSGASSVSPKVTSTASMVNDTPVSPKDVVLKKKSDVNPNVKPSSTTPQLPNESKDSTLNTNRGSSLNTNRSLYLDARSQLKPVASILSRQLSQEAKIEVVKVAADDDETPVDRLIKQGSIEQPVQG